MSELVIPENPKNYRRRALLITAIAMVIVYFLWNVPDLQIILYPLTLFTTYVHEAGHSLAAILTGGRVIGFLVSANGSGLATTAGGTASIVLPAGYLGTAFFGSLLFYVVNRFPRTADGLATMLGLGMIVFTLLFARPDETGAPIALFIGVGFGVALVVLGLRLPKMLTMLVLNVLAVFTALEAFMSLRYLIGNISASRGNISNDAVAFSREVAPLVPPTVIAITWAGIAVAMFAVALYYGAWKPLRRELDSSYDQSA